jgi:hypothetical protein
LIECFDLVVILTFTDVTFSLVSHKLANVHVTLACDEYQQMQANNVNRNPCYKV